MASTSKEKEVSLVPTEDSSIAEMKTQHEDEAQEVPKKDWDFAFILEELRHKKCSDLVERFYDSNTLLHVAASLSHDQIVEAILSIEQRQELLTAKNSSGDIPLHLAANAGHLSIVKKLLSRSSYHLMPQNSNGDPPLHVAENDDDLLKVPHLVKLSNQYHELLRAQNSNGDLPLHVATNAGHLSIVEYLVSLSRQYHEEFSELEDPKDFFFSGDANSRHMPLVQHLVKLSNQYQDLLIVQNSNGNIPLHVAANAGHLSIVKYLTAAYYCLHECLMAQNSNGDLPLHVAANAGHLSIVQHLVERSYLCKELFTTNAGKTSADANAGKTSAAANAGHLSIVQHLVESSHLCKELFKTNAGKTSADANAGKTSADANAGKTSKLLRVKNKEGNTPLHLALIKKYEEVDLNLIAKYHEMAKFLIEKDPHACTDKNKAKNDPLDIAIKAQDEELQNLMTSRPGLLGAAFWSDAEIKREHSNSESVILPHKPKNKVASMDSKLYEAVKSKNIDFIKKIAQDPEHKHPSLSDKTPELNTILHLAAASSDDDHEFVQEILEIQPFQKFVTEKNSNGDLPLHVAASAGNKKIVELLVKRSKGQLQDHSTCGPQWETNMEGNTPLHLALIKKFQLGRNLALKAKSNEVVWFLVTNDPKVSYYPNKERKSPLYMAAEAGDAELVKLMTMAYGKSIVHAALYYLMTITYLPYGKSIVHTAIYGSFTTTKKGHLGVSIYGSYTKGKIDILDTVLESLPNDILTVKDDEGMTPLFYAASIGYLKGVESLLRKTTKCCVYNDRDAYGYYPIHIASWKGHIKVVEKFLHEYPDMIELLTAKGQNILHVAAKYGKAKVVAYMLKRRDLKVEMLINNEDQDGNTPLHLAAMIGHPMVVSILTWDKRVDLNALNKAGKRALDIALYDSRKYPSFRERLTWQALRYVSSPRAPPRRINSKEPLTIAAYTGRTDTLLLVATLVATVTFAAAFTMPGGYKDSGGMAKFLEKPMFHVFVISNSIAMYSAITAVVALIWARLDDLNLFIAAYKFSVPMLGLAITMVSLAFMAGNYLVLRDHNWLAYLVLSIGSFFLFTLSIIFFPLCLPISSPHPIIRYILRYPFYLLIIFTRCDTDDGKEEIYT